MTATKLYEECCGDRQGAPATEECDCGCGLFYCRSCYHDHRIALLTKERDAMRSEARAARQRIADLENQLAKKTTRKRPRIAR